MYAKRRNDAQEDYVEWMLGALDANGDRYFSWGNHEDYMCDDSDRWSSPVEVSSPSELWELDDFNEVANFYFFAYRNEKTCPDCDGRCYNEETRRLDGSFYGRGGWERDLTQDEIDALFAKGRIRWEDESPDANEYNSRARTDVPPFYYDHDAIDRMICVRTRAKRLGVFGWCPTCDGRGSLTVDNHWRLGLQLWVLHPRKGASRGLICTDIAEGELPQVYAYLRGARDRMANVWAALPEGE